MGEAGDAVERQADAMADEALGRLRRKTQERHQHGPGCEHVMRRAEPATAGGDAQPVVGQAGGQLDASTSRAIEEARPQGRSLDGEVLSRMQQAFGSDLAGVRIHTDDTASRLSSAVSARAFTVGRDVFFGRGEYAPHTPDGERLLAHELAHTVQGRTTAMPASPVARSVLEHGMLAATTEASAPTSSSDVIHRVFDVAVKHAKRDGAPGYVIARIVIEDRPKAPPKSGMAKEGGSSFHHESAWTLIEKRVTQYEGMGLDEVVAHMVKYGLDGWPPMAAPGDDPMAQLEALNTYFHQFLEVTAGQAAGWLGPTTGHSSQGGKVSAGIRALKESWNEVNAVGLLKSTFEPSPSLGGIALWQAAESHADNFYSAFQRILEEDGVAAKISQEILEETLEWLTTWTTEYWSPEFDEMH